LRFNANRATNIADCPYMAIWGLISSPTRPKTTSGRYQWCCFLDFGWGGNGIQ